MHDTYPESGQVAAEAPNVDIVTVFRSTPVTSRSMDVPCRGERTFGSLSKPSTDTTTYDRTDSAAASSTEKTPVRLENRLLRCASTMMESPEQPWRYRT